TSFHNATQPFALRVFLLFLNGDSSPERVSNENRLGETQFIISVGEGGGIDLARCETDADSKSHGAVRDTLTKPSLTCTLRIDVMRKVVSRVPRMNDDISLGDRASRTDPLPTDHVIFEILGSRHGCTAPEESFGLFPPMAEESAPKPRLKASLTCGGPTLSPMRARKGTVIAAIAAPCGFNTG